MSKWICVNRNEKQEIEWYWVFKIRNFISNNGIEFLRKFSNNGIEYFKKISVYIYMSFLEWKEEGLQGFKVSFWMRSIWKDYYLLYHGNKQIDVADMGYISRERLTISWINGHVWIFMGFSQVLYLDIRLLVT